MNASIESELAKNSYNQPTIQADKLKEMMQYGLLLQRSDGTYETPEEQDRRLAHNMRMRFNRSFDSVFNELVFYALSAKRFSWWCRVDDA